MLGKKVQSHFKKFKSYIFGAGRKSGIGHSKLALALVFVAIFLLVTAGVSGYTETGFVSNRTNNARIVSLLKDFGGIMSRISIRDALSLQIPSELHSEAAATSEEIEDWLKEVGILDRNVWKQIMNQPHNLVKDNLERFVRQSLENNYGGRYRINVVEHIQKDSDYTLIGRRLQRNQYSYSISFLVQAAKLLKGAVASNAQGRSQSTIVDFSKQLGVSFVRNNTLRVSFYYDLRIGGSSNNRTDLRFVEIDITFD